jgi:DNA-binding XRE family transcriptional regulator
MTNIVEYIPWIVNPLRSILLRMERAFDSARAMLASNIKQLRHKVGMSQESLALAAEVDRSYVSQIERELGNPSLMILCRLADVLEVDVVSLLQDCQS